MVLADFFALVTADTQGFAKINLDQKVHAVLLDIDHSPSFWLNEGNGAFYTEQELQSLADKYSQAACLAYGQMKIRIMNSLNCLKRFSPPLSLIV